MEDVERILRRMGRERAESIVNRTDPVSGVTPLMACTNIYRQDNDETIRIAQLLMRYGATVDARDTSGPGVTPLIMAAQEGKPKLLSFLITQGADISLLPLNSNTQAIVLAAQNGRAKCVALLAEAAADQGKQILEARSKVGRTPSYIGVERAFPAVVGALAKAGADLRKACPVYFCINESDLVDPDPHFADHFALNCAVRSFVSCECTHCGKDNTLDNLSKCARCRMAYYCSRDCQKQNWAMHKKCCKELRKGQDMFGDPSRGVPSPANEPFGFEESFGAVDQVFSGCDDEYDPETHPVWEYNDRGGEPVSSSNWCRYPPRIEADLESLMELGSPRYMYKPNNESATGQYEQPLSLCPPPDVATRYVYYCDMVEREIYTGAARSVRRNGERKTPVLESPFPRSY